MAWQPSSRWVKCIVQPYSEYEASAGDHCANSSVSQQFHEKRMRLPAINNVCCMHALCQASDTALHPVADTKETIAYAADECVACELVGVFTENIMDLYRCRNAAGLVHISSKGVKGIDKDLNLDTICTVVSSCGIWRQRPTFARCPVQKTLLQA